MDAVERFLKRLNNILIVITGCCLAGLILLTCANVFLRIAWKPIMGTYELIRYSVAIVTALALGYTQVQKGYIAVDLVVQRYSDRTRKVIDCINNLICAIFFSIVTWKIAMYATKLWKTGELTETLQIIYYPFTYVAAFGCAVLCLVFVIEFLSSIIHK